MDSAPEKTLGISGPVTGRTNHFCLGSPVPAFGAPLKVWAGLRRKSRSS